MADLKRFIDSPDEIGYSPSQELQKNIEIHLDTLLGIQFLASDQEMGSEKESFSTIGIDENSSPVVIEYRYPLDQDFLHRGLYRLDYLQNHRAEFMRLALENIGREVAVNIDWSQPRLICIAADFDNYDIHAVRLLNRDIELLRCKYNRDKAPYLQRVHPTARKLPRKPRTDLMITT